MSRFTPIPLELIIQIKQNKANIFTKHFTVFMKVDGNLKNDSLLYALGLFCAPLQSQAGPYDVLLPDTRAEDLAVVVRFLYTGQCSLPAARLPAVAELAVTLGLSALLRAVSRILAPGHQQQDQEGELELEAKETSERPR